MVYNSYTFLIVKKLIKFVVIKLKDPMKKIFYKKIVALTFIVLTLATLSCNKESECDNSQRAKLVNMT